MKVTFSKPLFRKRLFLSTKPYYLERTREQGEGDLERLASTKTQECIWLFYEESCDWFNLGLEGGKVNTKEDGNEFYILSFFPVFQSESSRVSHYHTHPKLAEKLEIPLVESRLRNDSDEKIKNSDKIPQFARNLTASWMAEPSIEDIKTYSEISHKYPNLDIDFRIASPYGITIVEIGTSNPGEIQERYSCENSSRNLFNAILSNGDSPVGCISKGIEYLNNAMGDLMDIRFNPRGISFQ